MKQHTNKNLRRGLALFMTVLMMLSCFTAAFGVISFAAGASAPLLGRYFSTTNPWYDAVTGNDSGLGWVTGSYPSYDASSGFSYLNGDAYLRINNTSLFSGVSASTGLTVAFTYKPNAGGNYRHLLSFGANDASNINKHFYISSNPSHIGGGTQVPVVGYVDNNGAQHINAYPSNGPAFATGETYDVMISISATEITYLINGALCTTACDADSATYLTQFLNEVSGYQNNFIGRSRWNDPNFDGYVKDLRIYGAALLEKDNLITANAAAYDSAYGSTDLTTALTQSNVASQFNAVAYHTTNEATGAYSNLVYAPYNQTNFVGENGDYKEIGAIYFKIITPSNIVMVYDGAHDVYSPIEIETKKHDKAAVSNQAIRYVESQSGILPLAHYWYGYQDGGNNNEYMLWAGPHTENWFSHVADGSWDVGQDNKNTPRFWWNKVQYAGTGNTTSYYEHVQNLGFNVSSPFDNWGYKDGYGDITSESNYFVINYKPVYDALPYALACYNELTANAWMYTDASLARAKATIYQMIAANPKNSDYNYASDASAATVACAANITRAVNLLGASVGGTYGYEGLQLVKKSGTATFYEEDGTTVVATITADYGDTFTVPAVPTKTPNSQYHYTGAWDPTAAAGSAVMSDDYNKTFTATYTSEAHTGGTATCITQAECSVCHQLYGALLNHSYTAATVKPEAKKSDATCTSAAVYYYSCSVCGAVENDDEHTFTDGAPIAHSYTAATVKEAALKSAATCTSAAVYYYSCSVCGAVEANDEHTFTNGDPIAHAYAYASNNNGTHTVTCANCTLNETENCTFEDATVGGVAGKQCTKCGYFYVPSADLADYTVYDALFAKLQAVKANPNFNSLSEELINAVNNKVGNPLSRELTADQQGVVDNEVAAIRAILDQILYPDGHGGYTDSIQDSVLVYYTVTFNWSKTTLSKRVLKNQQVNPPTVTPIYSKDDKHYIFDGWKANATDTESAPNVDLDHVSADMTVYGYYRAENHTGTWNVVQPTCEANGWKEITCITCGEHYRETLNALGHTWDMDSGVVTKAATCAQPGVMTYTCTRDSSHTMTKPIPTTNHVDANRDEICDVCHNPMPGHQHTDWNGDEKCDVCGGKTGVHQHVDDNRDGVCDGCGRNMDGSFRCNLCPFWEQYRGIPVAGWFLTAFHFFYHLICQIVSWR